MISERINTFSLTAHISVIVLDQVASPVLLLILDAATSSKSLRLRRFKSNGDKTWQDCSSLNTHRLTESDFRLNVTLSRWWPICHHAEKCCSWWM